MDPSILFEIFSMTKDARDTRHFPPSQLPQRKFRQHFPPSQLPQRKFRQIRQIMEIRNRGMRSHLWNPTIKEVNKHRDQTNTVLSSIENCDSRKKVCNQNLLYVPIGPMWTVTGIQMSAKAFFFSVSLLVTVCCPSSGGMDSTYRVPLLDSKILRLHYV